MLPSEVEMGKEGGTGWRSGGQPACVIIRVHCNFYQQAPSILLMGQQESKSPTQGQPAGRLAQSVAEVSRAQTESHGRQARAPASQLL